MTRIKNNSGWLLILFLSLLPLVFWYHLRPISSRFSNNTLTLTSLGQMAGLVGMAMLALTMALSGRLKFLEDYFGGLNNMYSAHQTLGSLAFVLILLHPLFLAGKFLQTSARSGALLLLPSADWSINLGILALLSLLLLVVLTFFLALPYHRWEFSHKFMGVAFLFAGLHSFFIRSDISQDNVLRAYVLGLTAMGLLVYSYRTVLGELLVRRFEYRVEAVRPLNDRVIEIEMAPRKQPMRFAAGQFIFVRFHQPGISSEAHPFSMSSPPQEGKLRIVVKSLGDYTSRLGRLSHGAVAKVEGPFGRFSHRSCPNKKQIWIAGGIGITPFLSMAATLDNSDYSVDLYYSANTEGEAVFLDKLVALAEWNGCLRVIPFFADVRGFLTAEIISEMSSGLGDKDIFLCGPSPMMKGLTDQLTRMKVKYHRIHTDEFRLR